MFAAASLNALKGKMRSPQTEFRRPVKQKVDYPIEKLMQDNISVKWGGKADHCIMAFAPLAKHDAENMFKTKWQYDMKSSSNKPCDSDATIAGKNANLFLDSPPAAFGFMWDGPGQIKFCAQNIHYLNLQIAWLRANAEASEWPDEVIFAEDLPDEYHSGERIAIDVFLIDRIDISAQLSPGSSNCNTALYKSFQANNAGTLNTTSIKYIPFTSCLMPCAGEVNILFFPFKGYHFRACLPKQFPGGAWLKLTITPDAKPEWGRVWINPSFSLEAFQSFAQERGFEINPLGKDAFIEK